MYRSTVKKRCFVQSVNRKRCDLVKLWGDLINMYVSVFHSFSARKNVKFKA